MHLNYTMQNNHLVVTHEGKQLILDTGSLDTYPRNSFGMDAQTLSESVGFAADGFLGMDRMRERVVHIDRARRQVHLHEAPIDIAGICMAMEPNPVVPIITATVDETAYPVVIDTGAPISYLPPHSVQGKDVIRTERDFYPLFGEFEVPIVNADFRLGDRKITMPWGSLPGMLGVLGGHMAILGTGILDHFDLVLDFIQGSVTFSENG